MPDLTNDVATARLTVITGPPGAGKTSVATLLANRGRKSVHLPSDTFWHLIRMGRIDPWLPEADTQNGVVMDALVGAAMAFVHGGYDVFLDGIVGPWFIGRFASAASEASRPLNYVILRPLDEVCLRRAMARPPFDSQSEPLRAEGPIRDLCAQFRSLGQYEAHALDTSELTLDETVAAVEKGLTENRFRIP